MIRRILDDPLADCRARGDGIGFVGPDIPVDVLLASGRPFGHLPWRLSDSMDSADEWLESSFPFWARSILVQWEKGAFDDLHTVLFSRADDASQRLYYYIAELRRRGKLAGPDPRMFDIALIQRESSESHTERAVLDLMSLLDVSGDSLVAGIAKANKLRERLTMIDAHRSFDGPAFERLGRAALWTDPSEWLGNVDTAGTDAARRRILLAGSVPPDDRIHEIVERSGASVVGEAYALGLQRLGGAVAAHDDAPERALARQLRSASVSPRAFFDRAAWLVARTAEVRADAVVIWLTREDEALAWSVPAQRRALAEAGIPCLILSAASWQADDGAAGRIEALCAEAGHATA
jgi:hypothetical protein